MNLWKLIKSKGTELIIYIFNIFNLGFDKPIICWWRVFFYL